MTEKAVPLFKVMFMGRCPSCGKGRMFKGMLAVDERCGSCGFELKKHDVGDGAVFFSMLITGTVIAALAVFYEINYTPPVYIHFILWIPSTFIMSVLILRWSAAFLIAMQYRYNVLNFKGKND